jgi:transposase
MTQHKFRKLPSDLTDKEWQVLAPLMPLRKVKVGRPRNNDRQTINGILYVLSTGCRWADVPPERYGSGKTCWLSFTEWRNNGFWAILAGTLLLKLNNKRKINWNNAYLDTSVRQNKRGTLMRLTSVATREKRA